MRVSPVTAASATAAFLITIIAGAGQARTAVESLRGEPQGSRTMQYHQQQDDGTAGSTTGTVDGTSVDEGQRGQLQPRH